MINLKALLAKILSYPLVIETGTITRTLNNNSSVNCTWKYRKWSDGTYDLWGKINEQTYAMTLQSGYGFYTQIAVAYPNGFNTNIPEFVTAGRLGGSNGNSLMTVRVSNTYSDYVTLWVYDWSNPSIPCVLCIYVHGRWK